MAAAAQNLHQGRWLQPGFQFHDRHGIGVQLTNNRQTARRMSSFQNGVVMSSEPMVRNVLYQVKVDEIDNPRRAVYVSVGVVIQSPDTIPIPNRLWALNSAVAVTPLRVIFNNDLTKVTVKYSPLGTIVRGSHFGVMVDAENFLHLVKDGRDLGRVTPNPPLPPDSTVHALFDLGWPLKRVTSLPLTGRTRHGTSFGSHLVAPQQHTVQLMEDMNMAIDDFESMSLDDV